MTHEEALHLSRACALDLLNQVLLLGHRANCPANSVYGVDCDCGQLDARQRAFPALRATSQKGKHLFTVDIPACAKCGSETGEDCPSKEGL